MDKILVTIYVPSIDKEYDLFIPIKFQISEVLNSIQDSIVDLSNGAYKKKDKVFLYNSLGFAINPKNNVRNSGITNGEKLCLI